MTESHRPLVSGTIAAGYEGVRALLEHERSADPEYSFQLAVYRGADLVVDVFGGDGIDADTLMIPFSVSKNSIAFTIALLVERGLLDLDRRVSDYWPDFGSFGKEAVLVREMLSHQAGLPEAIPTLTDQEVADAETGAARLVDQVPWWRPGAAFGYHGVTIGVLASELVRRITGSTLQEFFENEIRAPRAIDFHLGLSAELESRVVELQPMIRPDRAPSEAPFPLRPGQIGRSVFAGVTVQRRPEEQLAHARWQRSVGLPAVSASVSARGIAGLFAESVVGITGEPLIGTGTIASMAQTQVVGTDQIIGIPRAYGVVFQKPTPNLAFGGFRAFGHDGAGGALGYHDPHTGISLGYTVRRTPPPGGADPRVLAIAALLQDLAAS